VYLRVSKEVRHVSEMPVDSTEFISSNNEPDERAYDKAQHQRQLVFLLTEIFDQLAESFS